MFLSCVSGLSEHSVFQFPWPLLKVSIVPPCWIGWLIIPVILVRPENEIFQKFAATVMNKINEWKPYSNAAVVNIALVYRDRPVPEPWLE